MDGVLVRKNDSAQSIHNDITGMRHSNEEGCVACTNVSYILLNPFIAFIYFSISTLICTKACFRFSARLDSSRLLSLSLSLPSSAACISILRHCATFVPQRVRRKYTITMVISQRMARCHDTHTQSQYGSCDSQAKATKRIRNGRMWFQEPDIPHFVENLFLCVLSRLVV